MCEIVHIARANDRKPTSMGIRQILQRNPGTKLPKRGLAHVERMAAQVVAVEPRSRRHSTEEFTDACLPAPPALVA